MNNMITLSVLDVLCLNIFHVHQICPIKVFCVTGYDIGRNTG